MIFLYRPDCNDCMMVKNWLDKYGVEYEARDMNTQPPSGEEIIAWADKGRFSLKSFLRPRKFNLKAVMLSNQMLSMERHARAFIIAGAHEFITCPIMVGDDFVVMGTDNAQWRKALNIQS